MRTFIAVEVPGEIKQKVREVQSALQRSGFSLRWVQPENMHLTLVFLGEVEGSLVSPLSEVLDEVTSRRQVFEIRIGGLGAFPNEKSPRVYWVGLLEGSSELCALQKEIQDGVRRLNIPLEKGRFHPHLTLGRCRDNRAPGAIPGSLREAVLGTTKVCAVHLIRSQLGGSQPVYSTLHSAQMSQP
ncbi:MAG TPA: RNA 2',3'-cyclic phosphodiesterase [bacterium]|nr:RNA 2',3'-cyclic phosphodiesterase [bacterium]